MTTAILPAIQCDHGVAMLENCRECENAQDRPPFISQCAVCGATDYHAPDCPEAR